MEAYPIDNRIILLWIEFLRQIGSFNRVILFTIEFEFCNIFIV